MQKVIIIGGGLAGTEAAYFLARHGIKVFLYEMRPHKTTGAHHTHKLGELVCSNSLKSMEVVNACGLLKKEMEVFDALLMRVAKATSVPGGNALCVDRELFSEMVTNIIKNEPNITLINEEITKIPDDALVVVASGPLTSDALTNELQTLIGSEFLSFF